MPFIMVDAFLWNSRCHWVWLMPNRLLEDNGYRDNWNSVALWEITKTRCTWGCSGTQNGGSSIAIQVEEVSIASVASNLSNNLGCKTRQVRSIKKLTGWNSFLKAAKGSCCKYDILKTLRYPSCFSAGFSECVIIKLRCRDIILHLWLNM